MYSRVVEQYDQALSSILAKDVQKFRSYTGKGVETNVGVALLYFIVSLDTSILMTNDKRSLLNPTWDEVKK
jgi:hypothetical protein